MAIRKSFTHSGGLNSRIYVLGSINFLWLLSFLVYTRHTTPIADDYCFAKLATMGVVEGTYEQFMTWDGNYTLTFLTVLFVGIPLLQFGAFMGSAFPFYVMQIFLFGIIILILKRYLLNKAVKKRYLILIGVIVLVCWNVFWLSLKLTPSLPDFEFAANFGMLSNGYLFWKTLHISYLFMYFLTLTISIYAWKKISQRKPSFALIIAGIVIGGSSYILAGTVLLAMQLFIIERGKSFVISSIRNNLFFTTSLIAATMINYLSPGSQKRKAVLDLALSPTRSIGNSAELTIQYIFESIFNYGFLFAILCGLLLAPLLHPNIFKLDLIRNGFRIFLLLSLFTTIGCYFAGSSPWRYSHIFISSWISGLLIGGLIFRSKFKNFLPTNLVLPSLVFYLLWLSIHIFPDINDRYEFFRIGPAPISGIEDIESPWVNGCAVAVNLQR